MTRSHVSDCRAVIMSDARPRHERPEEVQPSSLHWLNLSGIENAREMSGFEFGVAGEKVNQLALRMK